MLKRAGKNTAKNIVVAVEDATKLSFENASFDRLIATHVLEHLYRPHEVLREWARVLRPGGTLSIVLPCDPGLLWRIGRRFGPRARAHAQGIPYDYAMAREHVNSITNLVTFINYYFSDIEQYSVADPGASVRHQFNICGEHTRMSGQFYSYLLAAFCAVALAIGQIIFKSLWAPELPASPIYSLT